jgi:predicted metal-dependent HD superfamily phosphohydrolase
MLNKPEFYQILTELNIPEKDIETMCERIIDCYSEKQRDYHTLRHIREMLEILNQYKEFYQDYPSLYLACLYHDIVYDTHASDNEEKSADYLEKDLSKYLSKDRMEKCKGLILGTKKHYFIRDDFDNKVFLDSDLLILGRERNRYIEYMESIRKEYHWVETTIYRQERSKVLQKFLERERIYFTNEIFQKYEKQARENLNFELEMYFQK